MNAELCPRTSIPGWCILRNGGMTEWQNEGMMELRSPFSLASDLQIIIGLRDYDVTYTNNSWYSVTMMSRLRVLCWRQQQQKHFWNKVHYYSLHVYDRKSCRIRRVEQDENHADEILDFMPVGAIFYNYTRVNVSQCKWKQLIFLGPFA